MDLWLVVSVLVPVCATALPAALLVLDLRQDAAEVEPVTVTPGRPWRPGLSLAGAALLAGGPGRMVDAVLTDLVERGEVVADDGAFSVACPQAAPGPAASGPAASGPAASGPAASGPAASGAATAGSRVDAGIEAVVREAVAAVGAKGIGAVREWAAGCDRPFDEEHTRLVQQDLVIDASRRSQPLVMLCLAVFVGAWVALIAIMSPPGHHAILALVSCCASVVPPLVFLSWRPGFHGGDPRSVRGRRWVRRWSQIPPETFGQAWKVALQGLHGVTDDALYLRLVGYGAPEATWDLAQVGEAERLRRLTVYLLVEKGRRHT